MSQSEIYLLLKNKRISGNDNFLSPEEIRKELIIKGLAYERPSLYAQLGKLNIYGYLEKRRYYKNHTEIIRYRLKKEYL